MKNRIASLFELDELLAAPGTGHAPRSRKRPARHPSVRAGRTCPPGSKRKGAITSQSFDTGAPIRCEHNVAYKPVAPVDVAQPAPPGTPPSQQFGSDEYDVEAFEESEEEPSLRLASEDEASREASVEQTIDESPVPIEAPAETAPRDVERAFPASFAAQMNAVERDLADLAARSTAPDAIPPTPDTGATDADAADTPTPPVRASGHQVFDQMALGMGYATEFRLPPVQLSQVFSALDRQLDAERVAPYPAPRAGERREVEPPVSVPGHEILIKDLVGMPVPGGDVAAPSEQAAVGTEDVGSST